MSFVTRLLPSFVTRWSFCYTFEKRERVTETSHNKTPLHEWQIQNTCFCYTCDTCYTFCVGNYRAHAYDWRVEKTHFSGSDPMYRSYGYLPQRVTGNTCVTSNIICKAETMKPTIETESTIILGAHVGSPNSAAIVGSLRTETGSVEQGVIEHVGCTWSALARALADAAVIGARHVVILSNDEGLVTALTKPFPAPRGGEQVKVWNGVRGDGKYVLVDLGDEDHWSVLRALGLQWPGRFAVQLVSDLPKARALWEASHANS